MTHEARINDALKQLGEEFRLGMVQPEEYRSRRRLLLESWNERDVTTSPGSLRSLPPHIPAKGSVPVAPVAAPASKPKSKLLMIGIAVTAIFAASAYLTFKPKAASTAPAAPAETAPATPALPPASPEVLAVRKAAEDFLLANAWEQAPVEALLEQWRKLSADDRARAREEPALRTLRFKLGQNLEAEAQLVSPDAPAEDRQRLELLSRFAEELDS
jgi:hypothetical protein